MEEERRGAKIHVLLVPRLILCNFPTYSECDIILKDETTVAKSKWLLQLFPNIYLVTLADYFLRRVVCEQRKTLKG